MAEPQPAATGAPDLSAPPDLEAEIQKRLGTMTDVVTPRAQQFDAPSDLEAAINDRVMRKFSPEARTTNLQQRRAEEQKYLTSEVGKQVPGPVPSELGPAGWTDFWARADLSLSDTYEEKKNKFMTKFPEGDFVRVPKYGAPQPNYEILLRRNQNEPFIKLDAPFFDGIEFFGDFADLAGDMPSMMLEAVATRGTKILANMLRVATGSAMGDAAKEILEEARGYQLETFGQEARRTVERSTAAAVGIPLSVAITGPLNVIRGTGTLGLKKGATEAVQAAEAEALPNFLPTQLVKSPIIRKLTNQAAQLSGQITEYVQGQQEAAVGALMRLKGPYESAFLKGDLEKLNDLARRQILAASSVRNVDLSDGGAAIQQGIKEWDDLASTVVNRAYAEARQFETPRFDVSPVLKVAEEIEARGLGRTAEGEAVKLHPLATEVQRVIADLRKLDPSLPTVTRGDHVSDATEQLRALRERLWELKTPNAGEIKRQEHAEAGKLYGAITHALKNPTNAEPGFVESWARANALAESRFDTMDKLVVLKAGRSEQPAVLADSLAKPNQVDNLRLLNQMWDRDPARFEGVRTQFKDAVKADFLSPRTADGLTKKLDTFDQPTLDQLFTRVEQADLRKTGQAIDRLNALGIDRTLERQSQFDAIVGDLIIRPDTARIAQMKQLVNDPAFPADVRERTSRNLRAGVMQHVIDNSVKFSREDAGMILDRIKFEGEIKLLRDRGLLDFLTNRDKSVLANLEKVVPFLPTPEDFGSSLFGGEAVSGLRSLRLSAFHTMLEAVGTGRFVTSDLAQRLLIGRGKADPRAWTGIKAASAILTQEANELEKEARSQ